jgi:hypothetical protein
MADVLKVDEIATLRLTRNGLDILNQKFAPATEEWSYMSSERVTLSTNMTSYEQADMGSINTTNPGNHVFIRTERPVLIALNTTPQNVESDFLMMSGASITRLYFKNENTTNTTWVEYTVTDEDA